METIIWTIIVGAGLLVCGHYLGTRKVNETVAMALNHFMQELVTNKMITEKKLKEYIIKNYGPKRK